MQAGKNAMASVKETASNIAASPKSGMDKTKATLEEKLEKMTAHHPAAKQLAEQKKQDKTREAGGGGTGSRMPGTVESQPGLGLPGLQPLPTTPTLAPVTGRRPWNWWWLHLRRAWTLLAVVAALAV